MASSSIEAARGVLLESSSPSYPVQDDLPEQISSIKAEQIELLAKKVIRFILSWLGPVLKAKADGCVGPIILKSRNEMRESLEKKQDLHEKEEQFLRLALDPVKQKITQSFSRASWFLTHGVVFQLTDYAPLEILKKTLEMMGIQLEINEIPRKFHIRLFLDQKRTEEKSELIFALTDCGETEILMATFSLAELE